MFLSARPACYRMYPSTTFLSNSYHHLRHQPQDICSRVLPSQTDASHTTPVQIGFEAWLSNFAISRRIHLHIIHLVNKVFYTFVSNANRVSHIAQQPKTNSCICTGILYTTPGRYPCVSWHTLVYPNRAPHLCKAPIASATTNLDAKIVSNTHRIFCKTNLRDIIAKHLRGKTLLFHAVVLPCCTGVREYMQNVIRNFCTNPCFTVEEIKDQTAKLHRHRPQIASTHPIQIAKKKQKKQERN